MVDDRMDLPTYRKLIGADAAAGPKRSKFGNRITVIDGERYDSLLEAAYSLYLDQLKKIGAIAYYRRQQSFRLRGGTRYVVDFVVYSCRSLAPGVKTPQGTHEYIDVKGVETPEFKIKRNEIHAAYPEVFIRCVTKKEIDRSYVNTAKELSAGGL